MNFKHKKDDAKDISFIHEFDSILGWKYKKNLKNILYMDDPKRYLTTNKQGYRNNFDFSSTHKNTIFILGDSFTFGEEVSDNETFSYLLNISFKKRKFYNLGVNAYGYDQMLLTLKRYVEKYQPKSIILSYNFIDLNRAMLSFHDFFKPYFTLENNQLILHTDHIMSPQKALKNEKFKLKIIDFYYLFQERYFGDYDHYKKTRLDLNEKILYEISRVAKNNNSRLMMFYLPIAWEANDMSSSLLDGEKQMFDFCKKLALECYSSRDEFIRYQKLTGKKMKEDGHWTGEGHKAVFRSIQKVLGQ